MNTLVGGKFATKNIFLWAPDADPEPLSEMKLRTNLCHDNENLSRKTLYLSKIL